MHFSVLSHGRTVAHRHARRPFSLMRLLDLGRSRRALSDLDQARLDDIGLTRDRARAEASRPIWDVPASWLR